MTQSHGSKSEKQSFFDMIARLPLKVLFILLIIDLEIGLIFPYTLFLNGDKKVGQKPFFHFIKNHACNTEFMDEM
jgi:hypothetical protein